MKIRKIASIDELYCRYPRQNEAQEIYVELDCKNETVSVTYNAEIGNAVPFSVYHGHEQRFYIPLLSVEHTNDLLDQIGSLAETVFAGYESVWNGNNYVAQFTDEAQEAIEAINDLCADLDDDGDIAVWSIAEWLESADMPDANTSDDELAKMIDECQPDEENVFIDGDIEEYLTKKRTDARIEVVNDKYGDARQIDDDPTFYVIDNDVLTEISYNSDGELTAEPVNIELNGKSLPIMPDGLSDTSIGRAYATAHKKLTIMAKTRELNAWEQKYLNAEILADNYDAARCDAVPKQFRESCKSMAMSQLTMEAQRELERDNPEYFSVKREIESKNNQIAEINSEILMLQKQIDALKSKSNFIEKSKPSEPSGHLSTGSNRARERYKNITGEYPKLKY